MRANILSSITSIPNKITEHPEIGLLAVIYSYIQSVRFGDYIHELIDISYPIITWLSVIVGLLIGIATLILKIRQIRHGQKDRKDSE